MKYNLNARRFKRGTNAYVFQNKMKYSIKKDDGGNLLKG